MTTSTQFSWRNTLSVLCDTKVSLKLKGKFHNTIVRLTMLYETECWIIKNQHKNKIVETQLMWFSNVENFFIDFVVRKVNQMLIGYLE